MLVVTPPHRASSVTNSQLAMMELAQPVGLVLRQILSALSVTRAQLVMQAQRAFASCVYQEHTSVRTSTHA
jgi:hypothetical protein